MMRSSGAQYLLRWMLVAVVVVVVCVSEGVAGADSGAVSQQEGAALCALLHCTRGDSWRWRPEAEAGAVWNCSVDAAGGLVHNPCSHGGSSWQGVTCSSTPAECSSQVCQVTILDLTAYNMTGPIPPEIGNLTHLEALDLGINKLTGIIPSQLGQLSVLEKIAIYNNQLSGLIPVEIGQMTALEMLHFSFNLLTGPIPVELEHLTSLKVLFVYSNQLTGTIPVELGNLVALRQLAMSINYLSGTIPTELGYLTALDLLYIYSNQLTGFIPGELGQLTALGFLSLNHNQLSGPIPVEVAQLENLKEVALYTNYLSGSIPDGLWNLAGLDLLFLYGNQLTGHISEAIGQLTALEFLSIYDNQLSGPIPVDVSKLTALKTLAIYDNVLTGTIPVELGQLISLEVVYAFNNHLTGSIPITVGKLTALSHFLVYSNQLTGPFPTELGNLTNLELLYLYNNYFTSTIPSALGQLTSLEFLAIYSNQFTGHIPVELGQLSSLEQVSIFSNLLTGPILPGVVSGLVDVDQLFLYDNLLTGKLPDELSNMSLLRTLFLQDNLLTGGLEGVFNVSTQLHLTTIDISNNYLTGSLPSEMLLLPQLQVLSLSVNCFEEELSESLCNAKKVEVLSLNGLRAAEGCEDRIVFPLSDVALFNTVGGTIPPCVWSLQNLTVLHLVGNGLSGTLVDLLSPSAQRSEIFLSHNQLSGTIPSEFLKMEKLDLSYNHFAGEFPDYSQISQDMVMKLENNRISGQLPVSSLESVSNGSLSLLRGNMFSCNTIPDNDEYSHDYVCGSLHLNYSLFAFLSALVGIGCTVLIVVVLFLWRAANASNSEVQSIGAIILSHATYALNLGTNGWKMKCSQMDLRKIALLSDDFMEVIRCAVRLLSIILAGSLSWYLLKVLDSSGEYSTHSHTYSWFWTLAYVRGVVPAGLLLLVWVVAIIACFYRIVVVEKRMTKANQRELLVEEAHIKHNCQEEHDFVKYQYGHVCVAFVINAGITITVNALYIYSTQQNMSASAHFGLQISLSIFRILYSMTVLPLLSRFISGVIVNSRFRFTMLTINNLLIPCLVTALTSDSCFQGLLVEADSVRTPYSYKSCQEQSTSDGELFCKQFNTVQVESASLVPPFSYSNECGSVLLTTYIPVLILGYSFQLLISWSIVGLQLQLPYESFPLSIRSSLHGLMWPEYWAQNGDSLKDNKGTLNSDVMLKIRTILCNDVLNNWLVFMTFGLCSPPLAVAIVCCVIIKLFMWVVLVGRFTKYILQHNAAPVNNRLQQSPAPHSNDSSDTCRHIEDSTCVTLISVLGQVYIPLYTVLAQSFWRLALCSALFVALLGWDMAADEVGWLDALWIPLFSLGVLTVLICVDFLLSTHDRNDLEELIIVKDEAEPHLDINTAVVATRNPFHVESSSTP